MAKEVRIKRAYERPEKSDGYRVLVDRVWPRGIRKEDLRLDEWCKEIAPSTKLRQWFGHDQKRWQEFRERYEWELIDPQHQAQIRRIIEAAEASRDITLVYSAKDEEHNQAVVLCSVFARMLWKAPRKAVTGEVHERTTSKTH